MLEIQHLNWNKSNGLIPAIIQDSDSMQVLMLGYMNEEALKKTLETKRVTFFSRTKNRLWEKGETSGHTLHLVDITADCDQDAIEHENRIVFLHKVQQGPASKSYGLQVAHLAGIPATVIERAKEKLKTLSHQEHPVLEMLNKIDMSSLPQEEAFAKICLLKEMATTCTIIDG